MKSIKLNYDTKLYKEKSGNQTKKQKHIFKWDNIFIICCFSMLIWTMFLGLKPNLFKSQAISFGMFIGIPILFIVLLAFYIFYIRPKCNMIKIDPYVYFIQSLEEINTEAKFALTEDGDWLIWAKLDEDAEWISLNELFDDFGIESDIPKEWSTLTIDIDETAKIFANFS